MAFYLGKWLVEEAPPVVQGDWCFPDNIEHIKETSNPEDLNVSIESFSLFPEEVQGGIEKWGNVNFVPTDEFYVQQAPGIGGYYIQPVPGIGGFYVLPESLLDFYIITPPGLGGFYVAGPDAAYTFYPSAVPGIGGYYLQPESLLDFYLQTPPGIGGFYLQEEDC